MVLSARYASGASPNAVDNPGDIAGNVYERLLWESSFDRLPIKCARSLGLAVDRYILWLDGYLCFSSTTMTGDSARHNPWLATRAMSLQLPYNS